MLIRPDDGVIIDANDAMADATGQAKAALVRNRRVGTHHHHRILIAFILLLHHTAGPSVSRSDRPAPGEGRRRARLACDDEDRAGQGPLARR